MSIDCNVKLGVPIINPEVRTKIAKRFNEIHDQTFKRQEDRTYKGEVLPMTHQDEFSWINSETFFIPCHWDWEHAEQTKKDIKQVLKEFNIPNRVSIS